jgi:hypothetical protein
MKECRKVRVGIQRCRHRLGGARGDRVALGAGLPTPPACDRRLARVSRPRRLATGAWRGSPDPRRLDWRLARVSRPRRLARPTGLPRSSHTQVSEVFVLAKLTPNEGDLSVKHSGGVRRPAPSAGKRMGGVRRPAPSAGASQGGVYKQLRNIKAGASGYGAMATITANNPPIAALVDQRHQYIKGTSRQVRRV